MNLQQLRDFVRAQLDVDSEELPNEILDVYLGDSFVQTIATQPMWPFYESRWDVVKLPDVDNIPIPPSCDPTGIMSVIDTVTGIRLMQVSDELAEDHFIQGAGTASNPVYYSIFANEIRLWPQLPEGQRDYKVRGHRYPLDWIAQGASAEPDADARLHQLLCWHTISLTYAAQEDEVLEATYLQRWSQSLAVATRAILAPRHHRPLILNAGLPYVPGYAPPVWNLPT